MVIFIVMTINQTELMNNDENLKHIHTQFWLRMGMQMTTKQKIKNGITKTLPVKQNDARAVHKSAQDTSK